MKKTEATVLLGGTAASAAAEMGITPSAFCQWPDELPPRLVDRVQAALYRRLVGRAGAPEVPVSSAVSARNEGPMAQHQEAA